MDLNSYQGNIKKPQVIPPQPMQTHIKWFIRLSIILYHLLTLNSYEKTHFLTLIYILTDHFPHPGKFGKKIIENSSNRVLKQDD